MKNSSKKDNKMISASNTQRNKHSNVHRRITANNTSRVRSTSTTNRKVISPMQEREEELRRQAKRRKQRVKRRNYFAYFVMLLFIVGVGILLSFTVFFHIETITINGNSKYTSEELLSNIEIHKKDNLFLFNASAAEKSLKSHFPYIREVKIIRSLPSEVIINITEAEPKFVFESDNKYILIDSDMRILESDLSCSPADITKITGISLGEVIPGEKITCDNETNNVLIEKVIHAVLNCNIGKQKYISESTPPSLRGNIEIIDLSDILNIEMIFNDRLTLRMGTGTELDYKLAFSKKAIDELPVNAHGSLDLSVLKKATYSPMTSESKTKYDDYENNNKS